MENSITAFAEMIRDSENIVFFGGAGVSTESGVKDYRSEDGLYQTVKQYGVSPEVILSKSFFERKPEVFYDFFRKYFVISAEPNAAHKALAKLEETGRLKAVITQNVDGLHQKAGSGNVVELHGTVQEYHCHNCGKKSGDVLDIILSGEVPKCEHCGGLVRPSIVLYEEPLYDGVAERAVQYIANADMLIVGGTSMVVYPASSFVRYFSGRYTVMVNKTETQFDGNADLIVRESIGTVFEKVMNELK